MTQLSAIHPIAAGLALLLALFVLARERDTVATPLLGLALLLLALQKGLAYALLVTPLRPSVRISWLLVSALLPACWLAVSLSYGRAYPKTFLRRWRWVLASGAGLGMAAALVPYGEFFSDGPILLTADEMGAQGLPSAGLTGWVWPLELRGFVFFILLLLLYTLCLANLERTLRHSFGRVRWQVKFAVLGLGGYFAVVIYTSSEAVLFRIWSSSSLSIQSWTLLLALPLVAVALRRSRTLELDVYLSQSFLERSVAIMAVGTYLVGVGLVVELFAWLDWPLEIRAVLIFLAALVAAGVLLSDRARDSLRTMTRRHFHRPTHDYRQIWTHFNRETAHRQDEGDLGRALVRIISQSLECLSVSLWAVDGKGRSAVFLASTAMNRTEAGRLNLAWLVERAREADGVEDLTPAVDRSTFHVPRSARPRADEGSASGFGFRVSGSGREDREDPGTDSGSELPHSKAVSPQSGNLRESEPETRNPKPETSKVEPGTSNAGRKSSELDLITALTRPMTTDGGRGAEEHPWYLVPLRSAGELLGILLVGERIRWRPLTWEDQELLEVLADQSASVLRDIRTGRRLKEASEMAAFQSMSAFFLHDLKNLANRLSLTVQNLPKHYEKPEFREEAFRTIGHSVEKIKGMCSKLALLRETTELQPVETDFEGFIRTEVGRLGTQVGDRLVLESAAAGRVMLDGKQFRKVVVNLVFNAVEALEGPGSRETGPGRRETGGQRQKNGGTGKPENGVGVEEPTFKVPGSTSRDSETRDSELGTRNCELETRNPKRGTWNVERGTAKQAAEPRILVRTYGEGGWAVLEVSDNGCGMTPEFVQEKLFHPFQTTKQQGMGIGLFQSKMIVEEHGGRIEVSSEVGTGTTFRVLLPGL